MLEKTLNQPTRFRTKIWVKIIDEACGTCNANSQIKLKTSMLKSSLFDYSDAYVLVRRTITITVEGDNHAVNRADKRNKGVIFKNCVPFAYW